MRSCLYPDTFAYIDIHNDRKVRIRMYWWGWLTENQPLCPLARHSMSETTIPDYYRQNTSSDCATGMTNVCTDWVKFFTCSQSGLGIRWTAIIRLPDRLLRCMVWPRKGWIIVTSYQDILYKSRSFMESLLTMNRAVLSFELLYVEVNTLNSRNKVLISSDSIV